MSVYFFLSRIILNDHSLLKDKIRFVRKISALIIPIPLFAIYMILVPHTQIGDSWTEGIMKMLRFYLLSKVILAQLISLLVINFNWIISAFVLINALIISADYLKSLKYENIIETGFNSKYEGAYFYLLFIAVVYFLTRIPFVNNPRYMLPALPILMILFGGSLVRVLRKQSLITIMLTVLLTLLTVSSFRTVDPVSKKIMETFKFGSHELLQMARFEEPKRGIREGPPRI